MNKRESDTNEDHDVRMTAIKVQSNSEGNDEQVIFYDRGNSEAWLQISDEYLYYKP